MNPTSNLLASVALLGAAVTAHGAIIINSASIDSPFSYSQNFNSLPTGATGAALSWTDNNTIPGWYQAYDGTQGVTNSSYSFQVMPNGSGGVTSGGTSTVTSARFYNIGHANSSDRSLGIYRGNSFFGSVGTVFQNNTGGTLNSVTVGYTGEQWRRGGAVESSINFEYQIFSSITGFNVNSSPTNWIRVPTLKFNSLNNVGGALNLDGNFLGNFETIAPASIGLTVPQGHYLAIRWYQDRTDSDGNATSIYHHLAIDNVTLTATAIPEPATYASLVGFGVLALAALRRQRPRRS